MDTKFQDLIYRLFANPDSQLVEAFLTESKRHGVDFRRYFKIEELRKQLIPDATLDQINIHAIKLEDLSILSNQYFPNVFSINIQNCNLTDISILADNIIPKLRILNLENNNIIFISPGNYLENLEILFLSTNRINNLSVLERCQNLRKLTLDHNPIDVSTLNLSNLRSLQIISLNNTDIVEIPSKALPENLGSLSLRANKIKSIDSISHLKDLHCLFLDNNYIKDFSPLFSMKGLEYLNIRCNRITKKNAERLKEHLPENCVLYT